MNPLAKALNDQLSQLDGIINNMNNMNICDADCQKRKKVDRLRTQFNNATNKYNFLMFLNFSVNMDL